MSRLTLIASAAGLALVAGLALTTQHYRTNAIDYQRQRNELSQRLDAANAEIGAMVRGMQEVAELDIRYTKELSDAKATIDQLERDVSAGRRRLQLHADCKADPDTAPGGLGNAATAGLTADAERNYWRLRAGIEAVTKQVNYLQDYIKAHEK